MTIGDVIRIMGGNNIRSLNRILLLLGEGMEREETKGGLSVSLSIPFTCSVLGSAQCHPRRIGRREKLAWVLKWRFRFKQIIRVKYWACIIQYVSADSEYPLNALICIYWLCSLEKTGSIYKLTQTKTHDRNSFSLSLILLGVTLCDAVILRYQTPGVSM